jgi:ABC-type multidrug transport system fused ATPase/permease subunit
MNLVSLREKIGYVSQEPVLIIGTIRDNLLYGKNDATEAEIWSALKMASADFVKNELPD